MQSPQRSIELVIWLQLWVVVLFSINRYLTKYLLLTPCTRLSSDRSGDRQPQRKFTLHVPYPSIISFDFVFAIARVASFYPY